MSFLGKVYTIEKSENLIEFMSALGPIPEETKDALAKMKVSLKVEKNGDTYTLSIITDSKTKEIEFKSGVEFETEFMSGIVAKSTCIVEENGMTQTYQRDNEKVLTIKREYSGNQLIETVSSNYFDTTARRIYVQA